MDHISIKKNCGLYYFISFNNSMISLKYYGKNFRVECSGVRGSIWINFK